MLNAQLIINEASSSNSVFQDEFGDTPDWFEILNISNEAIAMEGWTITDNFEKPDKWSFKNVVLAPMEHKMIWASGRDLSEQSQARSFLKEGDEVKYSVPTVSVVSWWQNSHFDDTRWETGTIGLGYGDGDDLTQIPSGSRSVFIRKKFDVTGISDLSSLYFDIDFDDGFVAYLNGEEIARQNMSSGEPQYFEEATTNREAEMYTGGLPERYEVDPLLLVEGSNIFALQVHNVNANSSDLTAIPFLTGIFSKSNNSGSDVPSILNLADGELHTNFKISNEGETLYLFDDEMNFVDSLEVKELCPNNSLGRDIEQKDIVYFQQPTPGAVNNSPSYIGTVKEQIQFSKETGIYSPFTLTLGSLEDQYTIRYTIDGSEPDITSNEYIVPIQIRSNTVLRAKVFEDGYIPSKSISKSYLIDIDHRLPILSLIIDPDDLYDEENGIYSFGSDYNTNYPFFGANFWKDREKPIHVSYFAESEDFGFEYDLGVKIFGGWSRAHDQKSLALFARKAYGTDEISYPVFENRNYNSYQNLVFRNSGNDWLNSNMRDGTLVSLMEGSGLDLQAYQPAVAYLNGSYWGMYNIREKNNEHTIASKHNLDPDEINLLELEGMTIHGDNSGYLELIEFVEQNDLTDANAYNQLIEKIDVENYIMYQLTQIYFDNQDWPGNNNKFWNSNEHKWRWLLFDLDFAFGPWNTENYFNNTLAFALEAFGPEWPNPPWSTMMFRKLMQNISFRNQFVNQYADEMNSRFLPTMVREHIDSTAAHIAPEINQHYQRWNGNAPFWSAQVNNMKIFANLRPQNAKRHILQTLNLRDYHRIQLENNDNSKGYIQLNSLSIGENSWAGDYFEDVPISITAIPFQGYEFIRWEGDISSTDPEIQIDMKDNMKLVAIFTEPSNTSSTEKSSKLVYPNPAHNKCYFTEEGRKELYHQAGQCIKIFYGKELDLRELPDGVYFIKTESTTHRLIKN